MMILGMIVINMMIPLKGLARTSKEGSARTNVLNVPLLELTYWIYFEVNKIWSGNDISDYPIILVSSQGELSLLVLFQGV